MSSDNAHAGSAADTALHEAARWFARLASDSVSSVDHAEWRRWHDQDTAHAQAWQRMLGVRQRLDAVPARLASATLHQAGKSTGKGRRRALGALVALAVLGSAVWPVLQAIHWREWTADYRTAIGERRDLHLPDGTAVVLNTGTALDHRTRRRELRLYAGEIHVATPDVAQTGHAHRALRVETPHGVVQPLGTRFTVRVEEGWTRVVVLEKAVEVTPESGSRSLRVNAGEQVTFDAEHLGVTEAAATAADAWTRGSLVISDRPLSEVVAELARYRREGIELDPAVSSLRVSGAFPLDDIDRALAVLTQSLPVRIETSEQHRTRVVTK